MVLIYQIEFAIQHQLIISTSSSARKDVKLRPTIVQQRRSGLVVMGGDSCSRGRGFEPQQRILDGHFSLINSYCFL